MRTSEHITAFLAYIKGRVSYLNAFSNKDNVYLEIKYYKELQKTISEWGKSHKIYYQYLKGNINKQVAIQYMGCSERTFYRMKKKQEKCLIDFIKRKEKELGEKYRFEPFEGEVDVEIV